MLGGLMVDNDAWERVADRVRIELRREDQWTPATTEPQPADAIRIQRFEGDLLIELDQPRPVQLSPAFWQDHYQSSAVCRSVMIDLLPEGARPVPLRSATIRYTIKPNAPAAP